MSTTAPSVVIVGGVAGGMSTATRLRRNLPNARITVLERGPHVSFANCGLPYHVGGVIEERNGLLLNTPEALAARFGLDVRVNTEAVSINREAHTIQVRSTGGAAGVGPHSPAQDGTTEDLAYDYLVLSPGASPVRPPLPGIEHALTLRDVTDLDRIMASLTPATTNAVVLGGGFIGVELAENLTHRGISTTLVQRDAQILAPLDEEMIRPFEQRLRERGITLLLNAEAAEISATEVRLASGERLPSTLTIAAVGVRPEDSLARDAGLDTHERGGILVDDQHRTSDPHIFAVGDAALKRSARGPAFIALAQTANRHGRLVADVIAGRDVRSPEVFGTAIVGAFGMQAASVGMNERTLRADGRRYLAIHTHPVDHAGYYPGASRLDLKLLVEPATGQILGAQAVGDAGADKRIDVIATAMRAGLTAQDLADLELAYAPQFGSAKDPVNFLGMVAENRLRSDEGREETLQWHELDSALEAGATLIDVREEGEFAAGAIPGALNIPLNSLGTAELPDGEIIVHCQVGVRGHTAERLLAGRGVRARNLDGGYLTWKAGASAA